MFNLRPTYNIKIDLEISQNGPVRHVFAFPGSIMFPQQEPGISEPALFMLG